MVRWGHGEGGGVTAQGGHCSGAGPGFDAELLSAPQCGGGGTSAHPSAAFLPSFTAIRAVVHRSEKPPPNRGVGGGSGRPTLHDSSITFCIPAPPDSHGCSDGVTALTSEPNRDVTPHPVTTPHPPHPGDVSSHNYDIDLPLRRWDGGVGGNSSAGGAAWGHRRSRCWGGGADVPGRGRRDTAGGSGAPRAAAVPAAPPVLAVPTGRQRPLVAPHGPRTAGGARGGAASQHPPAPFSTPQLAAPRNPVAEGRVS